MSYDLVVPRLAQRVDDVAGVVSVFGNLRSLGSGRFVVDGSGFGIETIPSGAKLSAAAERGDGDEIAMEHVAAWLAGPEGTIADRHAGRTWTGAVLAEWLAITATLSGRALALNEERIRHEKLPRAMAGFRSRLDAIVTHALTGEPSSSLRARIHDELVFYAARPAVAWVVAPALARLGDLSRLESLAFVVPPNGTPDAFTIAASLGAVALPLFARALDEPDANRRRTVAATLHALRDPCVLPLVLRALEDRRATVREAVLGEGFGSLMQLDGARDALLPALTRLARDVNASVRALAAKWA